MTAEINEFEDPPDRLDETDDPFTVLAAAL